MVETKGLLRTPISSRQSEKYKRRKKRDWRSVEVRKSVYDVICAARRHNKESLGDVVGRWARSYIVAMNEIAEKDGLIEGPVH